MGLLDHFLALSNSPTAAIAAPKTDPTRPEILEDASPEAVNIKPILAELLSQLRAKNYGTKLSGLPAYQAIRAQDAAYQGRVALALAATINQAESEHSNPLCWEMGEVLATLLRTSLALTEADYLRLFTYYGLTAAGLEKSLPSLFAFPLSLILSQ